MVWLIEAQQAFLNMLSMTYINNNIKKTTICLMHS